MRISIISGGRRKDGRGSGCRGIGWGLVLLISVRREDFEFGLLFVPSYLVHAPREKCTLELPLKQSACIWRKAFGESSEWLCRDVFTLLCCTSATRSGAD